MAKIIFENSSNKNSLTPNREDSLIEFQRNIRQLSSAIVFSEKMAFKEQNKLHPRTRYSIYMNEFGTILNNMHSDSSLKIQPIENISDFELCKQAFKEIKPSLLEDPKYAGTFVAFVQGELQDFDSKKSSLVLRMYEKFGNIDMYIGKIEPEQKTSFIRSPRLR